MGGPNEILHYICIYIYANNTLYDSARSNSFPCFRGVLLALTDVAVGLFQTTTAIAERCVIRIQNDRA